MRHVLIAKQTPRIDLIIHHGVVVALSLWNGQDVSMRIAGVKLLNIVPRIRLSAKLVCLFCVPFCVASQLSAQTVVHADRETAASEPDPMWQAPLMLDADQPVEPAPPPPKFLGYREGDDPPPPRKLTAAEIERKNWEAAKRERVLSEFKLIEYEEVVAEPNPLPQPSEAYPASAATEQFAPALPVPQIESLPNGPIVAYETPQFTQAGSPAPLPPVESFDTGPIPSVDLPPLPESNWSGESIGTQTYFADGFDGNCDPYQDGMMIDCTEIAPFLEIMYKPGSDRSLLDLRGQLPVWADESSLLFADLRLRFDDESASAGNFGLAYRFLDDSDWIWGFHMYYDILQSSESNTFHQFSTGLEIMTLDHDFRLNGYFPDEGARSSNVQRNDSLGVLLTRNFDERASHGFDFEYGYRVLHWGWNDVHEVRWFNGLYHFAFDKRNFDSLTGFKSRIEYRLYGIPGLGHQARFTAGAELTADTERDTQVWAFARIRIPLTFGREEKFLDPLRRRFADTIVREID